MRHLMLALAVIVASGCIGTQHYSNPTKGFNATVPAGWSIYEDDMKVAFVSPDKGAEIFFFRTYSNHSANYSDIAQSMRAAFSSTAAGYKVVGEYSASRTVGGLPALEQHFSAISTNAPSLAATSYTFVYVKNGDQYYVISLLVFPSAESGEKREGYRRDFESVLKSFVPA